MAPIKAAWLAIESANTPMHLGALAIFQKPRKAGPHYLLEMASDFRSHTDLCEPWNQRLKNGGQGGWPPRLVDDEIDLDYHFRHTALPAPGGERQLGVLISRLHSLPLDRKRPLWEFHIIEGLENNRFAFYLKLHHALTSDVNLVPLLGELLSDSQRACIP